CVSAASYSGTSLASDSVAASFGVKLATQTQLASTIPLPMSLGGTTIKVRDSAGIERDAPLFFVSAGQINFLIPPGTANGLAEIMITSEGWTTGRTVQISAIAPGLFTANSDGQGVPAAIAVHAKPNGSQTFEFIADLDPATNRYVSRPIDLGPEGDVVALLLFGTCI